MLKRMLKHVAARCGYQIVNTAALAKQQESAEKKYPVADPEEYFILPKKGITYSHDLLYTYHNCDFIREPRFRESYEMGKATDVNNSVLSGTEIYWRIHTLCWAASQAVHLEGDFVDCGVNTGIFARAVINYIDFNKTGKQYFLLDTFTGLDERYSSSDEMNSALNTNYRRDQNTLYDRVVKTFEGFNVSIIKGAVPDTLSEVTAKKIAYLSVDMNCVMPEVAALDYFWDKLVPGGIIILDDYGYADYYREQKKAHDDFARSKNVEVFTLPTCQGMIIKPY